MMAELMEKRKREDLKKYVETLEKENEVAESEKRSLWRKIVETCEKEEEIVSMLWVFNDYWLNNLIINCKTTFALNTFNDNRKIFDTTNGAK